MSQNQNKARKRPKKKHYCKKELIGMFDYRPDGRLIWKISLAKRIKIGDVAGCVRGKDLRRVVRICGVLYYAYRLIYIMHHDESPKYIDHKNGNPSDDRIENLRSATHQENMCNLKTRQRGKTSRYKGVSWHSESQKWDARIRANGRQYFLGLFLEEIEAAQAYNTAAEKHHGKFANLNKIGGLK